MSQTSMTATSYNTVAYSRAAFEVSNTEYATTAVTPRIDCFSVLQADISLRLKESKALLDAVLALQPRDANASAGQRPDDVVLAVTQEVIAQTPGSLKHRKVGQCCRAAVSNIIQKSQNANFNGATAQPYDTPRRRFLSASLRSTPRVPVVRKYLSENYALEKYLEPGCSTRRFRFA